MHSLSLLGYTFCSDHPAFTYAVSSSKNILTVLLSPTNFLTLSHSLCLPRRVMSLHHMAQALSIPPCEAGAFKSKHSSSLSPMA